MYFKLYLRLSNKDNLSFKCLKKVSIMHLKLCMETKDAVFLIFFLISTLFYDHFYEELLIVCLAIDIY